MSDKKQKNEGKPVKERKTKTPEEREAAHIKKIEHSVSRTATWLKATSKAVNSRKYHIPPEKRAQILGFMSEKYDAFVASLSETPEEKKKVEEFKLA